MSDKRNVRDIRAIVRDGVTCRVREVDQSADDTADTAFARVVAAIVARRARRGDRR